MNLTVVGECANLAFPTSTLSRYTALSYFRTALTAPIISPKCLTPAAGTPSPKPSVPCDEEKVEKMGMEEGLYAVALVSAQAGCGCGIWLMRSF